MTLQLAKETTLEEAKQWLRDNIEDGARCPCCTQMAKVYKRTITSTMAVWLITLYRKAPGGEWMHIKQVANTHPGDSAKLTHWGLIEEKPKDESRKETRTSGFWRITPKGGLFVRGEIVVHKHARIYDSRLLGFEDTGTIDIRDALGKRFNYSELMSQ